jgi:hypothetical protein
MRSAPARRIVAELGVDDRAEKAVADAPEIVGAQLDALRHLWLSPDVAPRARSKRKKR